MFSRSIYIICAMVAYNSFLSGQGTYTSQPQLQSRSLELIHQANFSFKDLNKNNKLDVYEDWRKPVDVRVNDLLQKMTLEEKAGMMLINTLNADPYGKTSERAVDLIENEKMTRFIFRNTITNNPDRTPSTNAFRSSGVTPFEAAQFMNSVQEMAENTRLGIPLLFKSNARNHVDLDARAGINVSSGAFSAWPKEAGLAATRDMELIADFGKIMAEEWAAVGIRSMYGYMADLSTEPRWYRVHETFTEDSQLASDIIGTLIKNLQGKKLNAKSIALTIKHFPGGGPQEGGGDPHYAFGKNQAYPAGMFEYHLAPFKTAIDAGASSIMAYYGIPVGQIYLPNNVGMAFSRGIITELLRKRLGFRGYVNSDTGIIGDRAWGLEDKSVDEQIIIAIEAGTDILSGFNDNKQLLQLIKDGKLSESRVNESVKRLLKEQFELGLFENPFVDPNRAAYLVGNASFQRKAELAQRKSIVLLQNKQILPITNMLASNGPQILTVGMDEEVFKSSDWSKVKRTSLKAGEILTAVASGKADSADLAIIRIYVTNVSTGSDRMFGGASEDELNFLSFSDMAKAKSWKITPSLEEIKAIMSEVGEEKTILAIDFRQPYVIDEASGLLNAGAMLATFGVQDKALLEVITGKHNPSGKLPFALAKNAEAIIKQAPDAPGYPEEDTLFPFGFGLSY